MTDLGKYGKSQDCTGTYVAETGWAYITRLAEHKKNLRPANLAKVDDNNFNNKMTLVKHVITKDHKVDWNHSKILTFEINFTKCQFLKSFFIHNSENAINDNENCFHSEIYDNLPSSTVSYYSLLNHLLCLFFHCVAHYLYCLTCAFVCY